MPKSLHTLLFGLTAILVSCAKESEAEQRGSENHVSQPGPRTTARRRKSATGVPASQSGGSGGGSASSLLTRPAKGQKESRQAGTEIVVKIEKAEIQPPSAGIIGVRPDKYVVTLLVKVENRRDGPHPLVEARRFSLRASDGETTLTKVPPRISSRREPTFSRTYLKKHDKVSGWLTFDVPKEADTLTLETDLERPPLAIKVPPPRKAKGDRKN